MRHFIILVVATISEDYAFALILFTPLTFCACSQNTIVICMHRDKCFLPADRAEHIFITCQKGRERNFFLPVIFKYERERNADKEQHNRGWHKTRFKS